MVRLAIRLDDLEDDYRAAASRIRTVELVDKLESADGIVSDKEDAGNKPILLVGGEPRFSRPNVFPAFPWRFDPSVLAIRRSLGNLGKPALMRMHVWSPAAQSLGNKVAAVDLVLWLLGEQPEEVFSSSHPTGSEIIHLGFPNGGMALVDLVSALPVGEGYRSISLIGSHGAAYADDHHDRNLLFAGGPPSAFAPDSSRAFIGPMLEEFVAVILGGRDATEAMRDHQNALNAVRRAELA